MTTLIAEIAPARTVTTSAGALSIEVELPDVEAISIPSCA